MNPPLDALTGLSHRLIRQATGDDLDPFMLPGGSEFSSRGVHVRACFYYAIMATPRTTVLFDNQGRGGMCDLTAEEIVAAWDTQALLESQGLAWDGLDAPAPPQWRDLPKPWEVIDDLDAPQPPKSTGSWICSPRFAGPRPLSVLLAQDSVLRAEMTADRSFPPEAAPAPRPKAAR